MWTAGRGGPATSPSVTQVDARGHGERGGESGSGGEGERRRGGEGERGRGGEGEKGYCRTAGSRTRFLGHLIQCNTIQIILGYK